jgi:hypothetical protein
VFTHILLGASTITLARIREMAEKGYFMEGEAHPVGEETTLEPQDDEAVIFEDFSIEGLQMPPHPALVNILLKFQVQLHQLTPNTVALLSHPKILISECEPFFSINLNFQNDFI